MDLDGYVNLGAEYGKVKVAGLTADQAQEAILAQLRQILSSPVVVVTIEQRSRRDASGGTPPPKTGEVDQSSANQSLQTPGRIDVERGWEIVSDQEGRVTQARQLTEQEWAKNIARELYVGRQKLNAMLDSLLYTREQNSPQIGKLRDEAARFRREINIFEAQSRSRPTTYPPRDPTRDNLVTIFDLPHHATQIVDQWPKRDADMPIGLRYSEDVRKEFGKLAVEYRFYDHTPKTVITRGERGDERVVIPYVLVIKGPKPDRKEFVLPNWPDLKPNQEIHRTPGIIFAPANLKINNGEPLEIYIERFDPPNSSRVRVSNVVKVTWELPNQPRLHDQVTELDPRENRPSKQPPKERHPNKKPFAP